MSAPRYEDMTVEQQAVVRAADAAWKRQGKSFDPHDGRVVAVARLFRNHLVERQVSESTSAEEKRSLRCHDCGGRATPSDSAIVSRSKPVRSASKAEMVQRPVRLRVHLACMLSTDSVRS